MSQVRVNFTFALGKIWVNFHLCCFSAATEDPVVTFEEEENFHRGWNEEAEKIKKCQNISTFSVFSARCISPIDFSSRDHSRILFEQAFDDGMYQLKWGFLLVALHGGSSIPLFFVSDNFFDDRAIKPINATGHHLFTLCRSISAEERAQILDPIVKS